MSSYPNNWRAFARNYVYHPPPEDRPAYWDAEPEDRPAYWDAEPKKGRYRTLVNGLDVKE